MPLLYVDLLGMKARFHAGGISSARVGYRLLADVISEGLQVLPVDHPVSGGVQSDAAALAFDTTADALLVGKAIFAATFNRSVRARRLWIRGVIVAGANSHSSLMREEPLRNARDGIYERHFEDPVLRAINFEQGGFRGQRLLIEDRLVTDRLCDELCVRVNEGKVLPAHRLQFSHTPQGFRDVLWPVPTDLDAWPAAYRRMLDRLRYGSAHEHEWLQAAATHLFFTEIDSIVHGLRHDQPPTKP